MKDQWLIDYMENEMPERERREVRAHLNKNEEDRMELAGYQEIRDGLKKADRIEFSEEFWDELESKIMFAVDEKVAQKAATSAGAVAAARRGRKRIPVARVLGLTAILLSTILMSQAEQQNYQLLRPDFAQAMATDLESSPDEVRYLLTHQNADDFFVDVAAKNFDPMERELVKAITGKEKM